MKPTLISLTAAAVISAIYIIATSIPPAYAENYIPYRTAAPHSQSNALEVDTICLRWTKAIEHHENDVSQFAASVGAFSTVEVSGNCFIDHVRLADGYGIVRWESTHTLPGGEKSTTTYIKVIRR